MVVNKMVYKPPWQTSLAPFTGEFRDKGLLYSQFANRLQREMNPPHFSL